MTSMLRPYSTLLIGVVIGWFVVPRIADKLNVNLPS